MLVLTRKKGEKLYIGDSEVYVQKVSANRVTLSIKADRKTEILRGELKGKESEAEGGR